MPKDHGEMKRGFHHFSQAWYSKPIFKNGDRIIDGINIGFYATDISGEFSIYWMNLNGKVRLFLECDNWGWDALFQFKDVLEKMAEVDGKDISPLEFCELLKGCGIEDMTRRKEK